MELIVISDPGAVADEAVIINQLFQAGMTRFHLRKPNWNGDQYIKLLEGINQVFHKNIALHQNHHLTDRFEIKRLHYTERQRFITDQKKLINQQQKGFVLSTSIHALAEIPLQKCFDYVFFSPVFDSISKPGYESGLEEGFRLRRTKKVPQVIALGGIDETKLNRIKEMNFDGVAVLGILWNNPLQALIKFRKLRNCSETI